jgi:hypothetical protein
MKKPLPRLIEAARNIALTRFSGFIPASGQTPQTQPRPRFYEELRR